MSRHDDDNSGCIIAVFFLAAFCMLAFAVDRDREARIKQLHEQATFVLQQYKVPVKPGEPSVNVDTVLLSTYGDDDRDYIASQVITWMRLNPTRWIQHLLITRTEPGGPKALYVAYVDREPGNKSKRQYIQVYQDYGYGALRKALSQQRKLVTVLPITKEGAVDSIIVITEDL